MTGILLSAGFGTRLYPLTKNQPKALLDVGGRPILDYLFEQITKWPDCDRLNLLSNAKMFGQYYKWSRKWMPTLEEKACSFRMHSNGALEEDDRPGAVADLAGILRRVDTNNGAWVAATDSIYRIDLRPIIERFKESGYSQVIAFLQPNGQRLRNQSVLRLDGDRVLGVVDQPEDPPSKWVCPSFYVLSEEALEFLRSYVDSGEEYDSLGAFINALAQEHPVEAWRQPEGTPPDNFAASDLRFHINTRYQYDKARNILEKEPLMTSAVLS